MNTKPRSITHRQNISKANRQRFSLPKELEEQLPPLLGIEAPQEERERRYEQRYHKKMTLLNPEKVREADRRHMNTYRDRHGDKWRAYQADYHRRYYQMNKDIHYLRTMIAGIKSVLKKNDGSVGDMREPNLSVLKSLRKIGWGVESTQHVNHIVSLSYLVEFMGDNIDPIICYDTCNIEMVDAVDNHRASYRTVNDRVLKVAKRLEKKHPVAMKGFYEFILQHKGKTK